MKRIRQLHLYLGVLFAPAIIFFSLTGAFQTFGWHEGQHPAWISKLAAIHKEQHLAQSEPKGAGASDQKPEAESRAPREEVERGPSPLPLKIFVLLMSIGLITTTLLGVYMAYKFNRDRRIIWALLATGTILPILLLTI